MVGRGYITICVRVGGDREVPPREKDFPKLVCYFHLYVLLLLEILIMGFIMRAAPRCCVKDPQ